jgi:hypothetical protein
VGGGKRTSEPRAGVGTFGLGSVSLNSRTELGSLSTGAGVRIVVVAIYVHHGDIKQAHQFADGLYNMCERTATNAADIAKCASEREKNFNLSNPESWTGPAAIAAATFVAAAIYLSIGYYLLASLIIGLRARIGWGRRSGFQRFIIFMSAVFLAINFLIIYVISANEGVDRKVPVSIPGDLYIKVSNGYASAKGTWVRKIYPHLGQS